MKNIITTLICFIGLSALHAQNMNHRLTSSITVGNSLSSNVFSIDLSSDNPAEVKSQPVLHLGLDYALTDWFSLGLEGNFQQLDVEDLSVENGNSGTFARTNFNRTHFALRPMFHYGQKEKLDMFSGIRIGYFITRYTNVETDYPDYNVTEELTAEEQNRLSVGLTLFGIRYFFTENIGITSEINIGVPSMANIGLTARF